jgi:ubiquinone/menaquinone biosynthesis C-methylase UbiE
MTIWRAIGHQLRHPRGRAGWATGRFMRLVNIRPNNLAITALDVQPDDHVLELGCGPGHGLALLAARAPRGIVFGLDQSSEMVSQARAANRAAVRSGSVRLFQSRFEQLPFPDRSMDKVLAVNVAYFWQDSGRVLNEVRRVLRPGGLVSVYVTDAGTMRRWKFAEAETHRLFDLVSLGQTLYAGGFRAEGIVVEDVRVTRSIAGLVATAVA